MRSKLNLKSTFVFFNVWHNLVMLWILTQLFRKLLMCWRTNLDQVAFMRILSSLWWVIMDKPQMVIMVAAHQKKYISFFNHSESLMPTFLLILTRCLQVETSLFAMSLQSSSSAISSVSDSSFCHADLVCLVLMQILFISWRYWINPISLTFAIFWISYPFL